MSKLVLAAFTAAALSTAASTAYAGGLTATIGWGCHTCGFKNGTQLTGVALGNASTGTVSKVILPSGEVLDLR